MKKAVFPGSFDPITLGHVDVINRALPLFDELVIAIGINDSKKYKFSLKERLSFIEKTFEHVSNLSVMTYTGLTTEFCKDINANFILRGLRNPADFEFEKAIAITNRKLTGIDTVFLLTSADTAFISSSIVRDIIKHHGDLTKFAPQAVIDGIK
ncbi:pantetheine-phosphate adenylyltransferase [Wenyingzhuangia sp. IMCC45533]